MPTLAQPQAPAAVQTPARVVPRPSATVNRIVAAILLITAAAPLVVAAMLAPSSTGTGTHEQLGLPPCGFLAATGWPCATCGMTTSFAYAAHGHLIAAIKNQPAGGVLALGCAATVLIAGWSLYSGASLSPISRTIWHSRVVLAFAVFFLAAWVYKILLVTGRL